MPKRFYVTQMFTTGRLSCRLDLDLNPLHLVTGNLLFTHAHWFVPYAYSQAKCDWIQVSDFVLCISNQGLLKNYPINYHMIWYILSTHTRFHSNCPQNVEFTAKWVYPTLLFQISDCRFPSNFGKSIFLKNYSMNCYQNLHSRSSTYWRHSCKISSQSVKNCRFYSPKSRDM